MAENMTENAETAPEKMVSQEEFNRLVKERLAKQQRKHEEEKAQLMQQLQSQSQASQQPAQSQMQGMPAAQPSMPQMNPQAQQGAQMQPQMQQGAMTPDDFRSIMMEQEQARQKAMQQQQVQAAVAKHNQLMEQFKSQDPDFAKLISQENPLGLHGEMALKITNSLSPDAAKKTIKELMTNENLNLKANNAFLTGNYDQWLNKLLSSSAATNYGAKGQDVPDLSSKADTENAEPSDGNIMSYIQSLR